ncbi:MAG: SDR family oxidoreductase [Gemmatimonadetes bacterium]|nr:SDR family oxidoreductase [Gemmatimonadota bacterium]NIO31790.1 SDR family oxidoreductase [Gemmatimonadota bacterium]
MGLFEGKTALIFGVANERSIAWGIAQALHREGCELAFGYGAPTLEKRVRPLAESVGAKLVELCDVTDDTAIGRVFEKVNDMYGTIDVLVHSIAFADRRDLQGRFVETSRDGFKMALDVSAYSLVALTRAAEPLMSNGGSILTLTYYGSVKVAPQYNVMGVAKAALEACVRYLASDLGPKGIRVNAISAGPIKTLAASGVGGFKKILTYSEQASPLRTLVTTEDVGNTALWLLSDWSRGVTGEIVYVDAGWNIMGLTVPIDKLGEI